MSIRGVPQLVRLDLSYCVSGGSSEGAREFIRDQITEFHAANKSIQLSLIKAPNRHPVLAGQFRNGRTVKVPLRNKTSKEVLHHAHQLRQSIGRTAAPKLWPLAKTFNGSVQGSWREASNFVPLAEQIKLFGHKNDKILGVANKNQNQSTEATAADSAAPKKAETN